MITVGLTGGIGSGKSTVAKMFKDLGVPVYIADDEAKKIMNESLVVKNQVISLLGKDSYRNGVLNRSFVAEKVFNNVILLDQLNKIIHPAVAANFNSWKELQSFSYVIKEAAILFENGGYKKYDYIILVTAPVETRILRVLSRDKTTREEILLRMKHQWQDSEKKSLADFTLINEKLEKTLMKVHKIHNKLRIL